MRRTIVFLAAALAAAQTHEISGERIRAHARFLSHDLTEGRGIGTRGEIVTTEYLATQFALMGAKPGGPDGSWFQTVPLVGVQTLPQAQLSAHGRGRSLNFKWLDEFVGSSLRQRPLEQFEAEAVFVGHGIVAPEYGWDDFKGADVRGKILVLFTNEPPSDDPKFFGGRALTYYGRWTYKFEQALRAGALGALIIHTNATAGYPWSVVRGSWGREQPFVELAPGEKALALAGWLSEAAGEKLLALSGHSLASLLKAAQSREFRPMALGVRLRGRFPAKIRRIHTRNVIARIEGSDPELKSEAVLFTAHWDHLGIGEPVNGDAIYNGAVDNATGCGILLEMARAWAALEQKPRRSALFIAVTGEEGGLRGSEYYASHAVVPPGRTALALNFDAFHPLGLIRSVVTPGAERTTLYPVVEEVARRTQLEIKPDPHPEQGGYYRSDHFPLAKAGIPAFSVHQGGDFAGKPADFAEQLFREFNSKHYHQPSDEFREDWDFAGLEQIARFGFLLGLEAANLDNLPHWKPGEEFFAAREKSLAVR
ncbi:MAG: M28 family peptidase [Bryobacteraceae bacterium]